MEIEARERLLRVLELVHNAQANLIENVSPPEDPKEAEEHFCRAAGMLVDAVAMLGPLCGKDVLTPSGYLFHLALRKPA